MTQQRGKKNNTQRKSSGKTAEKKQDISQTTKTEIIAIIEIVFGLLIALGVYFIESSVFGKLVSAFIFGMFGVLGFAVPLIVIAIGVLMIIKSTTKAIDKAWLYVLIMLILLSTLINTNMLPVTKTLEVPGQALHEYSPSYFQYLADCYKQSMTPACGGAIGAILSYPLLKLLSTVGSNIAIAGFMLVDLLLITRISIREIGASLASISKSSKESRQRRRVERVERVERDGQYEERPRKQKRNDGPDVVDDEPDFVVPRSAKRKAPRPSNRVVPSWLEDPFETTSANTDDTAGAQTPADSETQAEDDEAPFDLFDDAVPTKTEPQQIDNDFGYSDMNDDAADTESGFSDTTEDGFSDTSDDDIFSDTSEFDYDDTVSPESTDGSSSGTMPYQRPPITLLSFSPPKANAGKMEAPDAKARTLVEALASFNIAVQVTNVSVGPTVTRFEIQPAKGVRIRSITALADDIALSLAAPKVRIEAPIPGKSAIGIEIPNTVTTTVDLRELIDTNAFRDARSPLTLAIGKDIVGKDVIADLAKMPHLLIAGTTGSGKSVCLNTIILSLVYKSSPDDMRLILIDPKMVEFKRFSKLPHLLVQVVTNTDMAASTLRWTVSEMERRNKLLADHDARDIASYNTACTNQEEHLPRIVVMIDEFSELMMTSPKEVEIAVARLAQLGRACGIHLILATQRPSADVITGIIKSNIASRIAFLVSDATNSRVILDAVGAEKLIGNGDMLFHPNGTPKPQRVQGAFVSSEEVRAVTEFFIRTRSTPHFDDAADTQITAGIGATSHGAQGSKKNGDDSGSKDDPMLVQAVRIVIHAERASASLLQRNMRIGYNRASILIEQMEKLKIVSGFDGSKSRKVLISPAEFEAMFNEPYGMDTEVIDDQE